MFCIKTLDPGINVDVTLTHTIQRVHTHHNTTPRGSSTTQHPVPAPWSWLVMPDVSASCSGSTQGIYKIFGRMF